MCSTDGAVLADRRIDQGAFAAEDQPQHHARPVTASAPNAQCQECSTISQLSVGTARMTPKAEPWATMAVGMPRWESGNHL